MVEEITLVLVVDEITLVLVVDEITLVLEVELDSHEDVEPTGEVSVVEEMILLDGPVG